MNEIRDEFEQDMDKKKEINEYYKFQIITKIICLVK